MNESFLSQLPEPSQSELARIRRLVEQLNGDYQAMRSQRQQLAEWEENQDFSILGEIELFATQIQGYASQVLSQKYRSSIEEIIHHLKSLKLFELDYFSAWYFNHSGEYSQIKSYVEAQDYLRLLLIEHLNRSLPLQPVLQ